MPRPKDERPMPLHVAIMGESFLGRYYDKSRMMVKIRCPRCNETRERPVSETRREMLRENWHGYCRQCSIAAVGDGTHRWNTAGTDRRGITSSGYTLVYPDEIENKLLPIYRAMQRCGQPVMGHRWAMGEFLGRALTSEELVDHQNGVKTDNRVSLNPLQNNLRLYRRGKQEAGSAPGHGTYYHEWQMELKRNHDLEQQISELRHLSGQSLQ